MAINRTYNPARHLLTEQLRVAVPLETKRAVEAVAHSTGRPVAAVVRDALAGVVGNAPGARR